MKVRLDFVTNSSTSSYICEVCGDVQAWFDIDLTDAEMIECENEHVVCLSHLGEVPDDGDFPYEVPAEFCPICTLEHVRDKDMLDFVLTALRRANGLFSDKGMVAKEMRRVAPNLEELRRWCDESKK